MGSGVTGARSGAGRGVESISTNAASMSQLPPERRREGVSQEPPEPRRVGVATGDGA